MKYIKTYEVITHEYTLRDFTGTTYWKYKHSMIDYIIKIQKLKNGFSMLYQNLILRDENNIDLFREMEKPGSALNGMLNAQDTLLRPATEDEILDFEYRYAKQKYNI